MGPMVGVKMRKDWLAKKTNLEHREYVIDLYLMDG